MTAGPTKTASSIPRRGSPILPKESMGTRRYYRRSSSANRETLEMAALSSCKDVTTSRGSSRRGRTFCWHRGISWIRRRRVSGGSRRCLIVLRRRCHHETILRRPYHRVMTPKKCCHRVTSTTKNLSLGRTPLTRRSRYRRTGRGTRWLIVGTTWNHLRWGSQWSTVTSRESPTSRGIWIGGSSSTTPSPK